MSQTSKMSFDQEEKETKMASKQKWHQNKSRIKNKQTNETRKGTKTKRQQNNK
jgi:hypothetical protein